MVSLLSRTRDQPDRVQSHRAGRALESVGLGPERGMSPGRYTRATHLRIPMKAATRSDRKRPAIPIESAHFGEVGAKRRRGSFTGLLLYPFSRLLTMACGVFA